MIYNDINLTREEYNESIYNIYGKFSIKYSEVQLFELDNTKIKEDDLLDKFYLRAKQAAYADIVAANNDKVLNHMIFGPLPDEVKEIFMAALVKQIGYRRINGDVETKRVQQINSSDSITSDPNQYMNNYDKLGIDTRQELEKIGYFSWQLSYDEDNFAVIKWRSVVLVQGIKGDKGSPGDGLLENDVASLPTNLSFGTIAYADDLDSFVRWTLNPDGTGSWVKINTKAFTPILTTPIDRTKLTAAEGVILDGTR